ncbi:MAG: ABC-2 family transporter protein [Chthoniobacterales bacterium]
MIAKYLKVFEIGLQNSFVYRWNFLARSLFGIVPVIATVFIWQAVFRERGASIQGYDFGRMIYYFMLILLAENLVTPTEDEWQIAADIRDGQINSFLTKPVNYLRYRFSLFLSTRLLYTAVSILPVAGIFFYFRSYVILPHELMTWVLAFFSLVMACFIQFLIAYALAMLAFWILEISTVVFLLYSFEYFLSGRLFPLDIMPHWFQAALKWMPFTYELYFPVAVFMGEIKGNALWQGLVIQAGWVIVTYLMAVGMWTSGIRKYEAVGG